VALGTMSYKCQSLAQDHGETLAAMGKRNVNLKFIPEGDGSPKIAQLVGYHRPAGAQGVVWPDIIADLTLPYGEVLLDYLR